MNKKSVQIKGVKSYLTFSFSLHGEVYARDVVIEVSCAEDIENLMKLYLEQDWKALLEDDFNPFSIDWVEFTGIHFSARGEHRLTAKLNDQQLYAVVEIDASAVVAEQQDKLKRIEAILFE